MIRARTAALACGLAGVLAGPACGGRYRKLPPEPKLSVTRTPTAGDPVLALLPPGPDVVIEIDLARARANPLVGPLIDRWVEGAGDADVLADVAVPNALAGAAWIVLAAYGVGTDDANTVTLVAPGRGVEVPGGVKLGDGVVALAPPLWIDKLRAVEPGASAADDRELLALRSRAMPTAAEGAVVRMTARLSADARIRLAGAIGIEPAPRAISAWADVADDAALIVDLDSRDPSDPAASRRLRTSVDRFLQRIANQPEVRALGLAPPIARTRIETTKRGTWLRAITVISPGRLRWAVAQAKGEAPPPGQASEDRAVTAYIVSPAPGPLGAELRVPGDKSIGHRALLFSLLSRRPVRVIGLGDGADNGRSAKAIAALGARVGPAPDGGGAVVIWGTGLAEMRAPTAPIDCGNSGTTIRLMCGLVAGQPFATTLFGDESLSKRPMRRVAEPLGRMGVPLAGAAGAGDLVPPLTVGPAPGPLTAIDYVMPVASGQVKSAILLAALYADGTTTVTEPGPTRDHTERLLRHLGAPIRVDGRRIELATGGWDRVLAGDRIAVPGDPSSSAFLIAAGVVAGSRGIRIAGVGINPTRTGFLDALAAMGAVVAIGNHTDAGGEPVADLELAAGPPAALTATTIAGDLVVRAIDEVPVLAVVAARASGTTIIRDAEELRVKESDRIATTVAMLRAFGVEAEARPDGLAVAGTGGAPLRAARVDAAGDHRIAMAAAIAGLVADGPTRIDDADNVATSYPGFVAALRALGATVEVDST